MTALVIGLCALASVVVCALTLRDALRRALSHLDAAEIVRVERRVEVVAVEVDTIKQRMSRMETGQLGRR